MGEPVVKRPLPPAIAAQVRARMKNSDTVRAPVPRRGRMNRTEAEYAGMLDQIKAAGHIIEYGFERVKLRLATGAWYCPDFDIRHPNGDVEFVEVKGGFIREASTVRLKVAAAQFSTCVFTLAQKNGGKWTARRIEA